MADFIIKYRWFVIISFLAVTGFFASQLPKMEIDPEVKNMVPGTLSSRVNTDKIEELFGGSEMVMIIVKTDDVLEAATLKRIKKISRKIKRIKGVDEVLSLFELKNIKGEDGAMIVEPAVKRIPKTRDQTEALRKTLRENDLVYGSVVSEDFQIANVIAILDFDVPSEGIIADIKKIVAENPGKAETFIGGFPITRQYIGTDIQADMKRLLPYGIIIMLLFLFVCFRQLRGVILPFMVVIMSVIVAMGLIPLLGWKITMITVLCPVILIAVANDYGIHIIARYQEDNKKGNTLSKQELAKMAFTGLSRPIILAGLTTFSGMLCLFGHILIPARQIGVLAGVGILYALAASLLFIPAVLSLIPKAKPVISEDATDKKRIMERLLEYFASVIAKSPGKIIIASLLFSFLVSSGIYFIMIDANPNNYFPKSHPVIKTSDIINEHLGGMQNISILYTGDIRDPRVLAKIDSVERALEQMPEVGITSSIARVMRMMSRALNDIGDEWYDTIPDNRQAIAQYFELYGMSGDPEDFEKLVDFPYENAVINARINTESTPSLRSVIQRVEAMNEGDPNFRVVGGFGTIILELADIVINGQLLSLSLAILTVGVLIMIMFRSIVAGLISAIPLLLSVGVLFGLMGYLKIHLNIATAMLTSIMIGVGIDYTLHFLWRYREERQNGLAPDRAVLKTLTTTGRGIVFNALSVIIGFVVLVLSSFMPVKFFGLLVVISIFACLVGAIILIPALCLVIRPKFLEPKI
ncbi:MAG: RND family transporter [Fibrobacteria bacterium]|nr:RND family transporter [Fibrobacteria bacterium]